MELAELLVWPRSLCGERLEWLLTVGSVQLAQITRDALLKLLSAPFHLRPGEVPICMQGFKLVFYDGEIGAGLIGLA